MKERKQYGVFSKEGKQYLEFRSSGTNWYDNHKCSILLEYIDKLFYQYFRLEGNKRLLNPFNNHILLILFYE